MKRIIDGTAYNTDTSTVLARLETPEEIVSVLYQTRGGAFFLHSHDEFLPLSADEALAWTTRGRVEVYPDFFDGPFAAMAEQGKASPLFVRLPVLLKERVNRAALDEGLSINAWVMRCMERCLREESINAA